MEVSICKLKRCYHKSQTEASFFDLQFETIYITAKLLTFVVTVDRYWSLLHFRLLSEYYGQAVPCTITRVRHVSVFKLISFNGINKECFCVFQIALENCLLQKERSRNGVKSTSRLNITKCLLLVGNYIRRQTERWAKQYEASKTHDIATMDKLISWLLANTPENDNTTVVHGDFRSVFSPIVNLIPSTFLTPTKQMKDPGNKAGSAC